MRWWRAYRPDPARGQDHRPCAGRERGSAGDAATAQARGLGGLNASQLPVVPKLFSGLGRLRCDARDGTDLKRLPGNVLGALAVMPNERCSRQALFGCDFVAMVVTCLQLN